MNIHVCMYVYIYMHICAYVHTYLLRNICDLYLGHVCMRYFLEIYMCNIYRSTTTQPKKKETHLALAVGAVIYIYVCMYIHIYNILLLHCIYMHMYIHIYTFG